MGRMSAPHTPASVVPELHPPWVWGTQGFLSSFLHFRECKGVTLHIALGRCRTLGLSIERPRTPATGLCSGDVKCGGLAISFLVLGFSFCLAIFGRRKKHRPPTTTHSDVERVSQVAVAKHISCYSLSAACHCSTEPFKRLARKAVALRDS